MVEQSDILQQRSANTDILDLFALLFGPELGIPEKETSEARRGDTVRLTNGRIVRVVSTAGGYLHTTEGTYAPWQVEKIAKS